jgi:hypothetical protein
VSHHGRPRSADVVSDWRSGDGRQDPASDSGPWRARHRPGLTVTATTVGRHGSSGPPAAHDAHRSTGEHSPAAAKTVRAAKRTELTSAHSPGTVGVANSYGLSVFECALACSSRTCRTAEIGWPHNLIPRDWPGYASCGPVGTTAPFVSSSSGSAGDGGPDQRIPLAWRARVRPNRAMRRP